MKRLPVIVLSMFVLLGGIARADSYNVDAVVPYDAPTMPAVITSPVDGYVTSFASLNISGTCEYIAPGTVVVVIRNASVAGSSACSIGGTFSVVIALSGGANQLVARTANLNLLYGPDSATIMVQYNIPPAPPVPEPTTEPLAPENPEAINPALAAPSDLVITSNTPFYIIEEAKKTVSITLQVDGGETPYDLVINWGDGTVETRRIESGGTYTFTYEYSKPGVYRASATVTDVKGTSRQYSFTVTSPIINNGETPAGTQTGVTIVKQSGWRWWYWVVWIIPLLVLCFALGMYAESRWIAGVKRRKKKNKK